MIPELGHYALILACLSALTLFVIPLLGSRQRWYNWLVLAKPLAVVQFGLVSLSFGCLAYAFYSNDFTVTYVAENSNSALPWYFRLAATWGGHEGSLLLWAWILSGWTAAVALFSRPLPLLITARVLAVMAAIAVGFHLFILLTSNPFARLLPLYPVDGRDLNPLLQDVGLIMHPPMLYLGYVGFSVVFAFAIAALLSGRLDAAWARWTRPWTLAAWVALTIGIVMGSWWAYYELGWGGWWFWDPVENASFMPWLAATALVHSLAVVEQRGVFKIWTVLLAILVFSLSLLGTFLVRSGVLVSVHAFASDPTRGIFILLFLGIVIGSSLALFVWRGATIKTVSQYRFFSKESLLAGNNALLVTAMFVVLIGTIWPLIYKEIGGGSLSVGPPYFNLMFTILVIPFALLLGAGPLTRWRQHPPVKLLRHLRWSLLGALVLGGAGLYLWQGGLNFHAALGAILALWVMLATLLDVKQRLYQNGQWRSWHRLPARYWGMILAHTGFAVALVGIALTSVYSVQRDVRLAVGDQYQVAGYQFHFEKMLPVKGQNYDGVAGRFMVTDQAGHTITQLDAAKRRYQVSGRVMTEAGIDGGIWRDLFIALGKPFADGSYAVRLYVKPFVRWIWGGGLLVALGGLLAAADRRYRRASARRAATVTAKGVS